MDLDFLNVKLLLGAAGSLLAVSALFWKQVNEENRTREKLIDKTNEILRILKK